MKGTKLIIAALMVFVILTTAVYAARLPTVNGDSDAWGTVLNDYLNVSHNDSGQLRADTVTNVQITDGSIEDADISDTTNLTLGEQIIFTLGEIIDNIIDGWIRITGSLNVTGNIETSGNVSANYFIGNGSLLTDISGDNASWNETYADTKYANIMWNYNQTAPFTDWLSVFIYDYNQTIPAIEYADAQDIIFNNSMKDYVDGQDIIFNNSVNSYINFQDIAFNDSMKAYVDEQVAGVPADGTGGWTNDSTQTYTNLTVGIGITSPLATLDINGSVIARSTFSIQRDDPNNMVQFFPQGGSGSREWWVGATRSGSGIVSAGSFFIWDQTAPAARLVIDDTGKVGIGTTSPNQELNVVGNANITGIIEADAIGNSSCHWVDVTTCGHLCGDGTYFESFCPDGEYMKGMSLNTYGAAAPYNFRIYCCKPGN